MDALQKADPFVRLTEEMGDKNTEPFPVIANEEAVDSGRDSSDPDEAVFDNLLDHGESSPDTSNASDDEELSEQAGSRRASYMRVSEEHAAHMTPPKQCSPFRKPSSVRAMQLDTTPPHLMNSAHYKYRMSSASRNSTPKSNRSYYNGLRSTKSSPTRSSTKKEYPLVLLHVTLLPVTCPYSPEVLGAVLPPYIIENWKLLHEKVSTTVLERGILIPHPREDYDLLEERLLESLELKIPRILKCGHFHLSPEEEADIEETEDEYEADTEHDICQDCGRRIRDNRFGSGSGQRRWGIKVYASNGLMRAGAWGAAWREMERVDVEILPWMDDEMRRQLDIRQEEENCQHFAETSHTDSPPRMDETRRREIYGELAQPLAETEASIDQERLGTLPTSRKHREVPLSELIFNYIKHLMQDWRNAAIIVLGLCMLHLLLRTEITPAPVIAPFQSQEPKAEIIPIADLSALRQPTVTPTYVVVSNSEDLALDDMLEAKESTGNFENLKSCDKQVESPLATAESPLATAERHEEL